MKPFAKHQGIHLQGEEFKQDLHTGVMIFSRKR